MKYILSLLILFALPVSADETPTPACSPILEKYGNVQLHRLMSRNDCWLSINPVQTDEPMKYRSFLISSNGLLMVFNSFGEGPEHETTGAREFFFLPRKNQIIDFQVDEKKKILTLKITNDQMLSFSLDTAQILSLSDAVVIVDKKIIPANKGGVSIKNNKAGVFLDCGFQRGSSPTQDPYSACSFIDPQNKTCAIMNHRLFNYEKDSSPRSDAELLRVYERFCKERKNGI